MSNQFASDLAKLKKLFGRPPVLSTESEEAFDEIWAQLIQCFGPKDFMEHSLTWQLTICTWVMIRYGRHGTLTIERRVLQHRQVQVRRIKILAERKQAAEKSGKPVTELDRMCVLEDVFDGAIEDIDKILNRPPEELEYARALEKGIDYYERIDELFHKAVRRRNDVIRQLELYREGLGQHLRQVSNEIIESKLKDPELQLPQGEAPLAPTLPGESNDL